MNILELRSSFASQCFPTCNKAVTLTGPATPTNGKVAAAGIWDFMAMRER